MKKFGLGLFAMMIVASSFSMVSANWCGNDSINPVDKAGVVTMWANIRDVACMLGSVKIDTLAAGTKVRIVGQTAWTQIILPDGRVGWIGNQFVRETSDRSGVPSRVNNAAIGNYCDTTNPTRCMNPAPLNVVPTFTYNNNTTATNPTTTTTTTTYTAPELTDTEKASWKAMIDAFVIKVEANFSSVDEQITELERVRDGLDMLKEKTVKYKPLLTYLVELLDEAATLKNIEGMFDL